jgi:hypothetical protein
MMKYFSAAALSAALLLGATTASAHHNANAQFDDSKSIELTGTLTEVRDISPHAQWKAMVVDPKTKAQALYNFETQNANNLRRLGLSMKTDVVVGKSFTFIFSPARDGSNTGFLTALVVNGKRYEIIKL